MVLAGTNPQPRLDRVLARAIDAGVWGSILLVLVVRLTVFAPLVVWWITLGSGAVLGLHGFVQVGRDRPTLWDRLASTRVASDVLEPRPGRSG